MFVLRQKTDTVNLWLKIGQAGIQKKSVDKELCNQFGFVYVDTDLKAVQETFEIQMDRSVLDRKPDLGFREK